MAPPATSPTGTSPATPPPASPEAKPAEEGKKETEGKDGEGKPATGARGKHFAVGLQINSDEWIMDIIGEQLPGTVIALNEKSQFIAKADVEFGVGDYVLAARGYGGIFQTRGIPGDDVTQPGNAWKAGFAIGAINPYSRQDHKAFVGIEFVGLNNYAGEDAGLAAPPPVARLSLSAENCMFACFGTDNLKFKLMSVQNTYFSLFGDTDLIEFEEDKERVRLEHQKATHFSRFSQIFVYSPLRIFEAGVSYCIDGCSEKDNGVLKDGPFRPGEALPNSLKVAINGLVGLNRARLVAPFANNRVLLGGFEVLGAEASKDLYDTVGLALNIFSVQSGAAMASNIKLRSEIWRRGDWLERGIMIGLDVALFSAFAGLTANRADDPRDYSGDFDLERLADPNISQEERDSINAQIQTSIDDFNENPGSVVDFDGRAGMMALSLMSFELGMTALDYWGGEYFLGNLHEFKKSFSDWGYNEYAFIVSRLGLLSLGTYLAVNSAEVMGLECSEGSNLPCSFGSRYPYFGTKEKGFNITMDDLRTQGDYQYIVASIGWGLLFYTVTDVQNLIEHYATDDNDGTGPKPPKDPDEKTSGLSNFMLDGSFGGPNREVMFKARANF